VYTFVHTPRLNGAPATQVQNDGMAGDAALNARIDKMMPSPDVSATEAPVKADPYAKFEVDYPVALIDNANIRFINYSERAVNYFWDFGDGSTAQGAVVTHQYSNVGVYAATLTSSKGNCSETKTIEIKVNSVNSTGRESIEVQNMNGAFYAVFSSEQIINSNIKIHNALGQLIGNEVTFEGKNGNVLLNLNDVPDGVYIVSIINGNNIVTRKIIK
jgi:PKD repeat protein